MYGGGAPPIAGGVIGGGLATTGGGLAWPIVFIALGMLVAGALLLRDGYIRRQKSKAAYA